LIAEVCLVAERDAYASRAMVVFSGIKDMEFHIAANGNQFSLALHVVNSYKTN